MKEIEEKFMTQGKQSKRFQIYRKYSIMNLEDDRFDQQDSIS